MPQLRRDPVVGRWVIIAPERADRPNAALRPQIVRDDESCPFCPGREDNTPPEVLARREPGSAPNGPGWWLRVVPNRYPALRVETQSARHARGVYDWAAGVGAHEVVIETPDHALQLSDQPVDGIVAILRAWQERLIDLARDTRLRSVVLFKNHGAPAGATLSHAHSQLVALPLVPPTLQVELDGARAWFDRTERCVYCDMLEQELDQKERLVVESDGAVAFAPWASRSPFEMAIFPREHVSSFEADPHGPSSSGQLRAVADALRTVLRKMDVALEQPAYNLLLHTMPLREPRNDFYHWHLELKPVLTQVAGFEWASGCFINPTAPEEAAAFLRQTEVAP